MRDKDGAEHTSRQKIADVFADFYEELYDQGPVQYENLLGAGPAAVPPFTIEEIKAEIKEMKRGKARDRSGIAEE
eukprot:10764700-Karenia_brevis.AAC.1